MIILRAYPPNIDEIDEAFKVKSQPTLYAYGRTIYNPFGIHIPAELRAHEFVHIVRQGGEPEEWWRRYIREAEFRLEEELVAHRVEYITFCRTQRDNAIRKEFLDAIARRLSGPLYNNMIDFAIARSAITSPKGRPA